MFTHICIKCGKEKEVTEFNKNGGIVMNTCKECVAVYNKKYRETHKEEIRLLKKNWVERNREKVNRDNIERRRRKLNKMKN